MATTRQTGQERRARRWHSLLTCGAFGLSLTLATGCSSAPTTAQQSYDPLLGQKVPPGTVVAPTNPPASASVAPMPPPAANTGGVPAIPTSSSSANTATLAGTNSPSPLGQPFPLNDPNAKAPFLPGQSTTANAPPAPGALPPNPNPKFEAVPDAVPSAPPAVTPTSGWQAPPNTQAIVQTASVTAAPDYTKQLQDRGVVTQKLDVVAGGVLLTCYVRNGTGDGVQIHEVPAKDFATAAQAILKSLDPQR